MTIQRLTPEEYNKFALGQVGHIQSKRRALDDNIEDMTYIYLYNMLRLNEMYINVLLVTKEVSELLDKLS